MLPAVRFSSIIRFLPINEGAHEIDLPAEADDRHPRDRVVEDEHIRFVGGLSGHEQLRCLARAHSSPISQRVGHDEKVGPTLLFTTHANTNG